MYGQRQVYSLLPQLRVDYHKRRIFAKIQNREYMLEVFGNKAQITYRTVWSDVGLQLFSLITVNQHMLYILSVQNSATSHKRFTVLNSNISRPAYPRKTNKESLNAQLCSYQIGTSFIKLSNGTKDGDTGGGGGVVKSGSIFQHFISSALQSKCVLGHIIMICLHLNSNDTTVKCSENCKCFKLGLDF